MSKFEVFIQTEYGALETCKTGDELQFEIVTDSAIVEVLPRYGSALGKKSYYDLAFSSSIIYCSVENFAAVIQVFKDVRGYIDTYFQAVLNDSFYEPFSYSRIKKLLTLNLPPVAKQKLEKILNDFTYIYLIRDGDTGLTKIGKSYDPQKRLQSLIKQGTLQSTPNNYFLICHWLDRNFSEQSLHAKFADQRVRGEWFRLSSENLKEIKDLSIDFSDAATIVVENFFENL